MSVFIELVKNDLNIAKNRNKNKLFWVKVYLALAVVCGFVTYTISLFYEQVSPEFILVVPPFLLLSFFITSLSITKREWKDKTIGWWMSLPYSRKLLLGSKLTVGLIRALRTTIIAIAVSMAFWFEGLIISPGLWKSYDLNGIFIHACGLYVFVFALCPLVLCFGILMTVLRHSKWRPATPLLWISFGFLVSGLFSRSFDQDRSKDFELSGIIPFSYNSIGIVPALAVGLLIAFVMFMLSAYLLENQVEI